MLRFWLAYCDPDERPIGIVITDPSSVLQASFRGAVEGLGQAAQFSEGHELDEANAGLVSADAIGRMLSLDEAGKITRRIEPSKNVLGQHHSRALEAELALRVDQIVVWFTNRARTLW